jgi:hypothetical protein
MNAIWLMPAADKRFKQSRTALVPAFSIPFEDDELIFTLIQVEK